MLRSPLAWLGSICLGVVVGLLLPVEGARLAAEASDTLRGTEQPPSLATAMRSAAAGSAVDGPAATTPPQAPRPIPPHLQDVGLEPPERDWRVVMEDPALDHAQRMDRLLAMAEKFRGWRQYEWADRTLGLVVDRTDAHSPLRFRAEIARGWNHHRQGKEGRALDAMERVAAAERAPKHLRAEAAYAAVLFAFGLKETERARSALAAFESYASEGQSGMRRDLETRFAALLRTEEEAR